MRRSKSKYDKCKYKRCTYRRTHPLDKPRYCAKHVDKVNAGYVAYTSPKMDKYIEQLNGLPETKPTIKQRVKSFIWK